jgi:hypothetical protein
VGDAVDLSVIDGVGTGVEMKVPVRVEDIVHDGDGTIVRVGLSVGDSVSVLNDETVALGLVVIKGLRVALGTSRVGSCHGPKVGRSSPLKGSLGLHLPAGALSQNGKAWQWPDIPNKR